MIDDRSIANDIDINAKQIKKYQNMQQIHVINISQMSYCTSIKYFSWIFLLIII